jgi:Na+/melibiose symporter-like transporter
VRRRPFLIVVNMASAVAVLPLLLVRSADQTWLIYAVMFAYGISLVVVDPAENALFAVMLPQDIRQRINGMRLALQEGGKLVAPLLGAGLFALVGGGAVAAVDAATFVLAALAVFRLQVEEPIPLPSKHSWRADLGAGFAHLWAVPVLRATTIAATIAMFISGVATPAQYSLVDALNRSPSFLGVLSGALGAGSIIASLSSGVVIRRIGERRLVAMGLVNMVVGYVLYMFGTIPTAGVGSLVFGFGLPWTVVGLINLAQRATPDALQGRVFAAMNLVLFGPQPLAQALGSGMIEQVDFRSMYLATATVALGTALALTAGELHRPERMGDVDHI